MGTVLVESREIDFSGGEKTYGLKIFREVWLVGGTSKVHWKYRYPDNVTVLPFTADGEVVAVYEPHLGLGSYVHLMGETMEDGERAFDTAKRGLLEETGYRAGTLTILSTILENSGKSDRRSYFILATDCKKIAESRESKIAVKLFGTMDAFSSCMMSYYLDDPKQAHGGGNTLKAIALWRAYAGLNP